MMLVTKTTRTRLVVRRTQVRKFIGSFYPGYPDQVTQSPDFKAVTKLASQFRLTFNSPSWRSRVAMGLNATGALTGVEERIFAQEGYLSWISQFLRNSPSWYQDTVVYRGHLLEVGSPIALSYSDTPAYNQAASRFYQDARNSQTAFQSLVSAGEFGQTLRQVNSAANGVYRGLWNYVHALRKGNVLKTLRLLSKEGKRKFITERWLEYSLGWKPLVMETVSLLDSLSETRKNMPDRVRVKGYGVVESAKQESGEYTYQFCKYKGLTKEKFQVVYYGLVLVDDQVAGLPRTEVYGLDSSNWLPSLWELIPYSFVVDYFTNIQDILSAWSFWTASVRWVSLTTRRTSSNESVAPRLVNPNDIDNVYFANPGWYLHEKKLVTRGAIEQVPVPSLEFEIPGCRTQWLNLAALFGASRSVQRLIR